MTKFQEMMDFIHTLCPLESVKEIIKQARNRKEEGV
jgi:hypothetical protein